MRLLGAQAITVAPMPAWLRRRQNVKISELPVRLHDVATGLAIGIGLLKASWTAGEGGPKSDAGRALELFEDSLARLRKLTAMTSSMTLRPIERQGFEDAITAEARRLRIQLELEIVGEETWLAPNHLELIQLVGREALRNVSRHSGAATCRVSLDASTCPYVLRVRDWGAGLEAGAMAQVGIGSLQRMAAEMGCQLGVGSQPGLGTELVLIGPICAKDRGAAQKRTSRLRG